MVQKEKLHLNLLDKLQVNMEGPALDMGQI